MDTQEAEKRVVFVPSFPPRRGGIATFTSDIIGGAAAWPNGSLLEPITRIPADIQTAMDKGTAGQDRIGEA